MENSIPTVPMAMVPKQFLESLSERLDFLTQEVAKLKPVNKGRKIFVDEIAQIVGRTRQTIILWNANKTNSCPLYQVKERGKIYAFELELREWAAAHGYCEPLEEQRA